MEPKYYYRVIVIKSRCKKHAVLPSMHPWCCLPCTRSPLVSSPPGAPSCAQECKTDFASQPSICPTSVGDLFSGNFSIRLLLWWLTKVCWQSLRWLHLNSMQCNSDETELALVLITITFAEMENVKSFTRTDINKPDFTRRKSRKSRHFSHFKPTKQNLWGFL